jgi:hypothetical protein
MTGMPAISWKGAVGLSGFVVYGPFMAMAVYALWFVQCQHCKWAALKVLPCGPALLPLEAGRIWLQLPLPRNTPGIILAVIVSLAFVVGLAWLVRRGRRTLCVASVVAFAVFSFFAFCTLSMIRS